MNANFKNSISNKKVKLDYFMTFTSVPIFKQIYPESNHFLKTHSV